ncbi:MAG: Ham1 family protein [Candidatus Paceibacter sp.]|jgi:inosine/xanthosine triphosphate pyrophosphatase family protein|nr:Ham1 family protein [Candidatus Paceibacter sp.]
MENNTELKEKQSKEIIFATTNDAKLKTMQSVLGDEFKVINLKDIGIEAQAEEDGINPIENALKKARYCYEQTSKPSFSMDFGFFIDGLPDDQQPGPSVKRIIPISKEREPNDEEVLEFYKNLITRLGGTAQAHWTRALAFVSNDGEFTAEIKIPKILTDKPSEKRKKGYPMTSLQIDLPTGKYECELTDEERAASHKIEDEAVKNFIQEHTK